MLTVLSPSYSDGSRRYTKEEEKAEFSRQGWRKSNTVLLTNAFGEIFKGKSTKMMA